MLMSFKEVKDFSLNNISLETIKLWKKNDVFNKSFNKKNADSFIFYEGPPSANGKPGIHHVMARTIKDIFCRYKTLKGYNVVRKAGWDTHGLPVELGVEKTLGITKDDIGNKISVEDYNSECKKAVMKYTSDWESLTELMGFWIDMSDPYVTYTPKYMETIWWLLKQFHDKNLLYKGYKIQPYSPAAGSGLSSHELNQPGAYKNISDTSIIAQFKCVEDGLSDELKSLFPFFFLAWTTTPWTLPSNTALTVGLSLRYSFIKTYNQYTNKPITVVLAKDLIKNVFSKNYIEVNSPNELQKFDGDSKKIPYLICQTIKGKDLTGLKYEQIWEESPAPVDNPENAFRVIAGDFVTTDGGTGIVHTAPTFGMDDYRVALNATPPVPALLCFDDKGNKVPLVDLQGKFVDKIGRLSAKFVKNEYYPDGKYPEKSVDVEIAIKLKEDNLAFRVEKHTHSYPHCWRTDKPVLYYPMESWFIKVSDYKEKMFDLNKSINWNPKSTGEGRFGNWLSQANDWNLSRSRFWGVPIPIWSNLDGSEQKIIGSVEELIEEITLSVENGIMKKNPFQNFEIGNMSDENYNKIDLHKDVIDKIILCSSKKEPMKRENDIIDVWFDSGSMPYAQLHYPFENKELIDSGEAFPADFIAEGVDQTRGWFYTLHVISTLIFDSIAYKNVISNGLVLDKEGQKMSKRLGNAIDPFETLNTYGADSTRWYLVYNSNPWDNLKFNEILMGLIILKKK
jgi:isoleucyl-tRNA synthetase